MTLGLQMRIVLQPMLLIRTFKMKRVSVFAFSVVLFASPVLAGTPTDSGERSMQTPRERLLQLAQSYSCSPRKTCSRTIGSCDEAYWLMQNCSWGGRLDGDNDGVPCENLC